MFNGVKPYEITHSFKTILSSKNRSFKKNNKKCCDLLKIIVIFKLN
jgi:hypothetical protein